MAKSRWASLTPDPYILLMLATVALASVLPASGPAAGWVNLAADAGVVLLFFLHGARLSREAITQGLTHWRLHLAVLGVTFCLFPILGVAGQAATASLIDPVLAAGVLFLCLVPSTVQSSIAFTAMARGNVAAAVCAASASNLIGIVLTPILVHLLMPQFGAGAGEGAPSGWGQVQAIASQLLLPFALGHLARPLIAGWVERHKPMVGLVDRGSILLIVYSAFSAAVVEGLWRRISAGDLVVLFVALAVLLAIALFATHALAKLMKLPRADEVVLVFCGSKKGLAAGVPLAGVLFAPAVAGPMIVPLMLFHQLQLMVCAALARHYGRAAEPL